MPLLNPLRTSTYTSSTSASTTPTQSAHVSLYIANGIEQNEDLAANSCFSYASSSSASISPSLSPKTALDPTPFLQTLYSLPERLSERSGGASSSAVTTPMPATPTADPHTRYMSSSESASSNDDASFTSSRAHSRRQSEEEEPESKPEQAPSRRPHSPSLSALPKEPPRTSRAASPEFFLDTAFEEAQYAELVIPPAIAVPALAPVPAPAPTPSSAVANRVNIRQAGKPRVVSISPSSGSPESSCFYKSQTSFSPSAVNERLSKSQYSTQGNYGEPVAPSRMLKYNDRNQQPAKSSKHQASLLSQQTFARKVVNGPIYNPPPSRSKKSAATYSELKPIASLACFDKQRPESSRSRRSQASDSKHQTSSSSSSSSQIAPQAPVVYPRNISSISAVEAQQSSSFAGVNSNSSRPGSRAQHKKSQSTSSTGFMAADVNAKKEASGWSKFLGKRKAVAPETKPSKAPQRSRGAGVRPNATPVPDPPLPASRGTIESRGSSSRANNRQPRPAQQRDDPRADDIWQILELDPRYDGDDGDSLYEGNSSTTRWPRPATTRSRSGSVHNLMRRLSILGVGEE